MSHPSIELPWGSEKIRLDLPERWNLAGVLEPAALPGVADPAAETARSLAEPIGSLRLGHLVHPEARVAVVVDDGSRPTPVHQILPAVISELNRAGVQLSQITLIPALGVHRPMSEAELFARVGESWRGQIAWDSPDCDNPEKMTFLGTTSRGTPVWVNKTAAEADLIVSIGCIEPHIIASFGGGYKNLIPGIAGRVTIAHNHAINCQPSTFNNVGRKIENNPMRLDLEEAGKMFKPPVFIVNAVLNSATEVVKIVSGDPVTAHRAGAKISASIFGVKIPAPADVVITASHPMDQDLRQGVKALANNIRALKRGGVMLILVRADEGVGVFGLANKKLPLGRGALKALAPVLLPLVPKLKLKGMGEEDKFFLYFALQAMRHGTLLLYGPTIPTEIHERLPFVSFVASPQEGLARAQQRFPKEASVLVLPHGGSTYPIVPE